MRTLTARRHGMRRAISALSVALALSGTLAASALAERPDDRAGTIAPAAAHVVSVVYERPDDQAVVSFVPAARPVGIRGPGGLSPAQVALPFVTAPDGFRWGDAVLVAVAMVGGVLAVGVLVLAVRQRGHLTSTT